MIQERGLICRLSHATVRIIIVSAVIPLTGCKLIGLRAFSIPSDSMCPLVCTGDKIIVDEDFYTNHPIQDGDVIVLHHNDNIILKRVSALPGETIEGKNGVLIRNGQPVSEPYLAPSTGNGLSATLSFAERRVPDKQIFVTGDNREYSLDSRVDEFGPAYIDNVMGKLWFVSHSKK